MKKFITILLILMGLQVQSQTLRVAGASSLRYILNDIVEAYNDTYPGTEIQITLGASGALTQQIVNGADFDFFMAADKKYPEYLRKQGLTSGVVRTYAFGQLALWSNSVDVSGGLQVLKSKEISRIAIANPAIAPYGEAAVECLRYYGFYESVQNKLVFADNISQAAQFAQSGNAGVSFLAFSLVLGKELKGKGNYLLLDPKSYKPVEQACVILKEGTKNPASVKFMDFILGISCRDLFKKYGYIMPE